MKCVSSVCICYYSPAARLQLRVRLAGRKRVNLQVNFTCRRYAPTVLLQGSNLQFPPPPTFDHGRLSLCLVCIPMRRFLWSLHHPSRDMKRKARKTCSTFIKLFIKLDEPSRGQAKRAINNIHLHRSRIKIRSLLKYPKQTKE